MSVGRHGRRNAAAMALVFAWVLGSGSEASATTASGYANATVIGEIQSLPLVIRFRTGGQDPSTAVAPRSLDDLTARSQASFGVRLIGMDAAGSATFSVAGATTSSYVIQTTTAGHSDSASGASAGSAPEGGAAAALIMPLQAVSDAGGPSIVISQATAGPRGELRVMINYN